MDTNTNTWSKSRSIKISSCTFIMDTIFLPVYVMFQFDVDYLEFRNQFDGLRQQIQAFVDSWFEKQLTVCSIISVIQPKVYAPICANL